MAITKKAIFGFFSDSIRHSHNSITLPIDPELQNIFSLPLPLARLKKA